MKYFSFLFIVIWAGVGAVLAQTSAPEKAPVEFNAAGIGKMNLEVFVAGPEVFLPVTEVFKSLGIKAVYDPLSRKVSGFFISPDSTYVIDLTTGNASLQNRVFRLSVKDYVIDTQVVYIRAGFLRTMFGLDFRFKPRRLLVELIHTSKLPAAMSAARKRRNLRRVTKQFSIPTPDEFLGHEFRIVGGGKLNWSLNSQFLRTSYLGTRYDFSLGSHLIGGDFTGRITGFHLQKRSQGEFRGQIRYPFFDTPYLRQIIIGDFASSGIRPNFVRGVEVTNRPLTSRFQFSREVFSGQFDPNTDVELDAVGSGTYFQQTDDEGNYRFDIPTVYGHGNIQIRAVDAYGQERILRYRMNLPATVLPTGTVEYSLAFGGTRRAPKMFVFNDYVNWGVSSALTLGTKLEYLDLPTNHRPKFFPAFTAVSRVGHGMILNGIVAPTAYSQLSYEWEFPSSASIGLAAIHYARNSYYNPIGLRKSYEASLRLPFSLRGNGAGFSMFANQSFADLYRLREVQASLNIALGTVQPTLSTQAQWRLDYGKATTLTLHQTIAALGAFLPAGVFFKAEGFYNHVLHRIESIDILIAKRFSSSFQFVFTFNRLLPFQSYEAGLRLTYYLPMMRTQSGVSTSGGNRYVFTAGASGSINYDPNNFSLNFENTPTRNNTGGIILQPFYDLNNNSALDDGEVFVTGAKMYVANNTRGTKAHSVSARASVLSHLPSYEEYDVYLDPKSLDNPLWVPDNGSFRVLTEPNYVKRLNIPIVDGGTVRGLIQVRTNTATTPAERIKVRLTSIAGERRFRKYETSSFSTGEFEFIAVPPGQYELTLDPAQLDELGYNAEPDFHQVVIVGKTDGDIIETQDFVLTNR